MDFGSSGGLGGWIQYHDRANFSTRYPLHLQPNGGNFYVGNGSNLKISATGSEVNVEKPFGFARYSSDPTGTRSGQVYYNTTTNLARIYDGNNWTDINAEKDPFASDVLLYLRGGSTSAALSDQVYSVSSQGASLSSAPGKPFAAAPSTSWYQINTSSTGSYINIGNSTAAHFSPSNYTDFTIEFWWMPYGTNGGYGHFYWVGGQGNDGIIKYGGASSGGGGTNYGMYWYTNTTMIETGGANTHYQGTWYHIVYEKYGSKNTFWVNGNRTSQNTNGWVSQNEQGDFKLGYSSPTSEYNAHFFDELRITAAARYKGVATIDVQDKPWPTE
jgi:hypothetical protein